MECFTSQGANQIDIAPFFNTTVPRIMWLVFLFFFCWLRPVSAGLSATDLLVVYNRSMPASEQVARYYAAQRNVPADNLIGLEMFKSAIGGR